MGAGPFDLASLAEALTAAEPRFVVWKGGSAPDQQGDLDGAAPRDAWPALRRAFERWAAAHGLAATVTCEHAVGMLVLVGCGTGDRRLLQLDVVAEKLVHGVPAWSAAELLACAMTTGGVRTTTPGAEGLARILAHRRDATGAGLVAGDPVGAEKLAAQFGVRGRLALRTGPLAHLALETVLVVRALIAPRRVMRAVRTDSPRRACLVLRALAMGRVAPEPVTDWLARVSVDHRVAGDA